MRASILAAISFSETPSDSMSGISPATIEDILHASLVAAISFSSLTDTVAEMALPAFTTSMPSATFFTYSTAAYVAEFTLNPTLVHPFRASLMNASRSARS